MRTQELTNSKLRIIVSGVIAQYPLGGLSWHYLQYLLGLQSLGHDIYFLEDTGQWPYDPRARGKSSDGSYNVQYLRSLMERFGLAEKWAYCLPGPDQWYGLSDARRKAVIESADLLINVSGTLYRPAEYRAIARLAYVDTDPVFTQIKLALGREAWQTRIDIHDVHFSFGERCVEELPQTGHCWWPTRQPVALSQWRPEMPRGNNFSTIMSWKSYGSVEYQGRSYGQKDVEFSRFVDLPSAVAPSALTVALNLAEPSVHNQLTQKGWHVVDPSVVCSDIDSYRNFIESSMAEWSVAKNAYVAMRSGWFSDRSACYLAAGRPVVVQNTGFDAVLPTGEGILPFATVDEAVTGIQEVERNFLRHANAARGIAEQYFDANKVLGALIETAMNRHHPGDVERVAPTSR